MSRKSFQTFNPENNKPLKEYLYLSDAEIQKKLTDAYSLFVKAKTYSPSQKSQILLTVEKSLRAHTDEFAMLMAQEMGKPIADGKQEVTKCADSIRFFVNQAETYLKTETLAAQYQETTLVKQGLGLWLAIMPWNFPLWQVIRAFIPNVLAGQPLLLKHANLVAGTAELLEKVIHESGEPWLQNLRLDHETTEGIIADRRVVGVSFTGSTKAGRKIAELAGKNLKKSILELGGSDAYLVFADSDLKKAAEVCVQSRMINSGQSCIAAKRFIVEKSVLKEFKDYFVQALGAYKQGSPLEEKTKLGPMAAKNFQEQLFEQCRWLEGFSQIVFQGNADLEKGAGAYFSARVYEVNLQKISAEQKNEYRALELFGPVSQILSFESEKEAISIANDSDYGLGAAVWTKDSEKAKRVALELVAGTVVINSFVRSDARAPFGGVKDSGYGKELSYLGFLDCVGLKVIGKD